MGVLTKASSVLMLAMAGDTSPAEGKPAEGRPAEARESRQGADRGVLAEAADLKASAGKEALTGVVSARVGLLVGMMGVRESRAGRTWRSEWWSWRRAGRKAVKSSE